MSFAAESCTRRGAARDQLCGAQLAFSNPFSRWPQMGAAAAAAAATRNKSRVSKREASNSAQISARFVTKRNFSGGNNNSYSLQLKPTSAPAFVWPPERSEGSLIEATQRVCVCVCMRPAPIKRRRRTSTGRQSCRKVAAAVACLLSRAII